MRRVVSSPNGWRRRSLLEIGLKAVHRLRELLGYLAPGCDAIMIAAPTKFLNFFTYDARCSPPVPSPTGARIHDSSIFRSYIHGTVLFSPT
jgi:hypothetical protein